MELSVDIPWLLEIARTQLADPDVTDWGSLEAARARHCFSVMDEPVYPRAHHRAAALFEVLCRIPALERDNEFFAAATAAGYLHASGLTVRVTAKEAADVAEQVTSNRLDVRELAKVLKGWTDRA